MQQHIKDHSGGHELAVHTLVSCSVCTYQIPRGALSCPRCGQPGPGSRTPQTARKRHSIGECFLGTLMMLAGALSFFYVPYPINLVTGPALLILGAAKASAWHCGRCGAKVDRDTIDCPRCALPFSGL